MQAARQPPVAGEIHKGQNAVKKIETCSFFKVVSFSIVSVKLRLGLRMFQLQKKSGHRTALVQSAIFGIRNGAYFDV